MRIAVNTRFLRETHLEGYGYFIHELMQRITTTHAEHQFLFLFDGPFPEKYLYNSNISSQIITPKARHPLSFRYWYDIQLSAAAKKFKADVIVSLDSFCSLYTRIPQVLAVHDLAFLHYPNLITKLNYWFYKTHQHRFIKKATQIVTVSEFSKQDIIRYCPAAANKITNIHSAAKPIFKPLEGYSAKQTIKETYADGEEYFLFIGGIHPRKNLIHLLKAFSQFKKWQKSSMKLLVAGRMAWMHEDFLQKLDTYKYRTDVVLLDYVPEEKLVKITASAYAVVFPSLFEGFGVPILEAMQSGVPVITSNTSSMPEIGGEAALYASPTDVDELANAMMRLYKDENLRNNLIQKGLQHATTFSWDKSAALLWQVIESTAQKRQ